MGHHSGQTAVLIVDAGGRGAALVDKYARSEHVDRLVAVPGNDLMHINTAKPVRTYPGVATTSAQAIVEIAEREHVALVDVAQDNAVASGLVDLLAARGIRAVGPSREAAQIEWDKAWARDFCTRHGIPQPHFRVCRSPHDAIDYLRRAPDQRWFVKAAYLAEGKGALPARSNNEAIERVGELDRFGDAAAVFLLEEWLTGDDGAGEEISAFAIADRGRFRFIGAAQDYKRSHDRDEGGNTGGMGSSTPTTLLTPDLKREIEDAFIGRAIDGLREEGRPYRGILYLGAMIVKRGVQLRPFTIEFNARWGDPEAQVIVPGLRGDLMEISTALLEDTLSQADLSSDGKARVVVAGASRGYPDDYASVVGKRIRGINEAAKLEGIKIYGAAVREIDGTHYAAGGRLLHVVGEGQTVIEARQKAYAAMSMIHVEDNNLHFRTDIGWRDAQRLWSDVDRQALSR